MCVCASTHCALSNSRYCSPPGSSVHGILQGIIMEWVAISSRASSQPRDQTHVSCISALAGRFFITAPPGKTLIISQLLSSLSVVFIIVIVLDFASFRQAVLQSG